MMQVPLPACPFLPWSWGAGTPQKPNPGFISSWTKTSGVSDPFTCPVGRWPMDLFIYLFGKKRAWLLVLCHWFLPCPHLASSSRYTPCPPFSLLLPAFQM